jgi:integrase
MKGGADAARAGDNDVRETIELLHRYSPRCGVFQCRILGKAWEWDLHGRRLLSKTGLMSRQYRGLSMPHAPLFEALEAKHKEDPQQYPEVPARFNWHALRHFAISCWIEADLKPKTVQTFAGHSSLQVTMDRYGHLFKSDDHKKAMDSIAADLLA